MILLLLWNYNVGLNCGPTFSQLFNTLEAVDLFYEHFCDQ